MNSDRRYRLFTRDSSPHPIVCIALGIFLGVLLTYLLMNRPIEVMHSQVGEERRNSERASAYNLKMQKIIEGNKQTKKEFDKLNQTDLLP
jgi:hypothetical protein